MSTAEIAVHGGRGRRPARGSQIGAAAAARPLLRLATFSALATYGVVRWATLETPAPGGKLLSLLALTVAVAALAPWLDRRSRPLAIFALLIAFAAMLAIAGIPVSWLTHARVAVIAQTIGQGLSALPNSVVPYDGFDPTLRLVIALGAGALLLVAAIVVSLAPGRLGDMRRAAAALPLIALAVVPATLVRPQLPYLQGLILFALVAAFMWAERVSPRRGLGAVGVAGIAGIAGMALGPALEQHHPWVNPRGLAGSLTPVRIDTFDWTQRYGPFNWPRDNRDVLAIKAARPDYWKAENLDAFNGFGWAAGPGVTGSQVPPPSPASLSRWTQTIEVTFRSMASTDVIAGGVASRPRHVNEDVIPGPSDGTWITATPLRSGDSYTVSTYSPAPTSATLEADRGNYPPAALADELTIGLPWRGLQTGAPAEVEFPVFHSGGSVQNVIGPIGVSGESLIVNSPYASAYALARSLASTARTPLAFVQDVERYLSAVHGFVYDEHPPTSPYPLETFLFSSRHGYCQQFAGAMALLLRMGGVPARVATGFTTGEFDGATHQYVVSDLDAHAWVEVWFPRYGWVRFDPTPASAPARAGGGLLPALRGKAGARPHRGTRRNIVDAGAGAPAAARRGSGGGVPLAGLVVGLLALLAAVGVAARTLTRPAPSSEQLVAELERAMARSGRPLQTGVTLHALEHRFRGAPEAAGYVRRLRLARFAGQARLPRPSERRALRAQLAAGLGLVGRLRAWWALPPRALH